MTARERFLATMLFEATDRVPFDPGHGRKSTHEVWHRQGLPADVTDVTAYVCRLLDIPGAAMPPRVDPGIDFRMIPRFEEKVLERRPAAPGSGGPGSLVVQDWKGNICEISDEFDPTYLRDPIDFVTRSWIKCPVETRADWEAMKRRYVVDDPSRFPADFDDRARVLRDRTYPSTLALSGPFW